MLGEQPKSTCPFAFHAQIYASPVPQYLMQELEEEIQKPTGMRTIGSLKLSVNVLLIGRECEIMYGIIESEGLRYVMDYHILELLHICLSQDHVPLKVINTPHTPIISLLKFPHDLPQLQDAGSASLSCLSCTAANRKEVVHHRAWPASLAALSLPSHSGLCLLCRTHCVYHFGQRQAFADAHRPSLFVLYTI